MQFDGAVADRAAAGQGDDRSTPARQQRPQDANTGPHSPHQRGRRTADAPVDHIESQCIIVARDVDPQRAQQAA
jgi:hypothetical protein